ncbi:hypothetical protein [Streptomyces fuscigenes]|uniref:hypothetical protein n=1 Tax=Streptomyces fuscigenes TaxID=1528880 RepID=UPI001F1C40D0|nr:hypothetical protein [Streptomyces fuscigenes]MCF3963879.1 hypothetical protein [Streptomyces fuscigenes]
MSTVLIVVGLIVVFVIVVALVLYLGPGRGTGKAGLRRRFGPEYDRAVSRHDGNTAEAEHELKERVNRYGDLRVRPLTAQQREHWTAQWAGLQERFVESPREAVARAEALIGELAEARGYPASGGPGGSGEQVDALSVHHAHRIDAYRKMRRAARPDEGDGAGAAADTEELREVMVGARGLFEQLMAARPGDGRRGRAAGRAGRKETFSVRPKGSGV